MCEKNTVKESYKQQALQMLASGYKNELVEYIEGDQRLCDLMMELVADFIEEKLPIVDEDAKYDLGFMLMDKIGLKAF